MLTRGLTGIMLRWCRTCGLLVVFMCLAGCPTGQRLRVVTAPPGSTVTVKDETGKLLKAKTQVAPVEVRLKFESGGERYVVEAQPSTANAERYRVTTEEVTQSRYDSLPEVRKAVRELTVRLDEKDYRQIRVINLKLDPEQGWVGYVTEERAYREVTEAGGAVPAMIVDFEEGLGIIGLAMDPQGEDIVFSTAEYDVDNLEIIKELRLDEHREMPLRHANLQGVRVTGGGIQHITDENFQDMYPSFTHDGRYLMFSSNRRRPNSMDILRTSADGRGGIADVYTDQRGARAVKPSQAADGAIAFALYPFGWRDPGQVQIWTTGGPSEFPTQITLGLQPQISPTGSHITYIGPDGNLWVVGADGREKTQLTHGAARILERFKESLTGVELSQFEVYERRGTLLRHYHPFSFPSWTPDGERILFTSMEGLDPTERPNEDIWIMNRDGTRKEQLTTNGSVDRYPLMSPDQKYIYFMSNRGLKWAIWRIAAPRGFVR